MQSLFALQQSKDANYQLCQDHISEKFSPDLNSMEVQDKALLNKQKEQALKLLDDSFTGSNSLSSEEDPKIKAAVDESITLYHKLGKKDLDFFRKNLVLEVEKIYDHYIAVLGLAEAFASVAAGDKKMSHSNFISNAWIKALSESEVLKQEASKRSRQWSSRADLVKTWFRDVVRQDTEYQSYLDKKKPSAEEQKKFINHFFKKIILGKSVINDFFEEEVLRWAEDKEIVKGLVEKTIKSFVPDEQASITLHTLSLNWDEDREFIEKLYQTTVELDSEYKELIGQNTRNWEVDRLPLTDRIILEMAIAELLNFTSIPVKVTINEYIELAKNYSTPKSRQFINGILDVIAKELKEKGVIRKSGRGLIDNK